MDTPSQPRRKLKRVLKKVHSLNSSSTHKLSQKKLRVAINTSLNSTNSHRTLKNNNYALALRLENVKEELKVTRDEKNDLLMENYALREKVISLEQKKDRVEVDAIRKILNSLNTHMSNFCVDLEQLTQICFPRASSSLDNQHGLDVRQRSLSGDSGDCGIQTGEIEMLPTPASKSVAGDMYATDAGSSDFEQQYASSVSKMKNIERRLQMENELPRRIRRSLNCPEEDEDGCVDMTGLEQHNDDSISGLTNIEQPPLFSEIAEELDTEEFEKEAGNKKSSARFTRSKKRKNLPKQPVALGASKDLHIANEFALNAVHLNLMEKSKEKDLDTMFAEDEERTIHMPSDMELTMPVDTTVLTVASNSEHFETFRENLSAKPRRLTKVLSEAGDDQSSDELVPDAVTMKKMKPGLLKFSVGRKDSEGCRKEIVDRSRSRSRSKKRIAELVQQLPQEEPKSIFDFHEKTPKFSHEDAEDALSVYSLADESASSPCAPLKRDKVTCSNGKGLASNGFESLPSAESFEPLNDSHSIMSSKESRLSRSRSRNPKRGTRRSSIADSHFASNIPEKDESNGLTLIGGTTYSEPLKDSPNNGTKKSSRISRSRSRRRTKPLLDTTKEYLSDAENIHQDEADDYNTTKEIECLQILKDKSDETPKKLSKISRSRSQRRRKTSDITEINCQDENNLELNDKDSELCNVSSENDSKAAQNHSQVRNNAEETKLNNNEEAFAVGDQPMGKLPSLLGEGLTYSVALKDSPNKTPKVNKRSRSQSARSTRSAKRSLKANENTTDDNNTNSPSQDKKSFSRAVPLNDSPVKTPEGNKRSKSQSSRLTRSTGRSLKSNKISVADSSTLSKSKKSCLETEFNAMNHDNTGLQTDDSERLKDQLSEIVSAEQNNAFASNDVFKSHIEDPQFILNHDIATVNTRRKKSSKSRRLRTAEIDDEALISIPDAGEKNILDDDLEDFAIKELKNEIQSKNSEDKKSRSKKLRNQKLRNSFEIVNMDSNEKAENVGGDKHTNISHQVDNHTWLETNGTDEGACPDDVETSMPPTTTSLVTVEEITSISEPSVDKDSENFQPTTKDLDNDCSLKTISASDTHSRKRKIKHDLCEDENKGRSKSISKSVGSKQSRDAKSLTTDMQEGKKSDFISSASGVSSPCEQEVSVSKRTEVAKNPKKSRPHSLKPLEQDMSPLKDDTNLSSSDSMTMLPTTSTLLEQESSDFQPGRYRRNKQPVSYAEPTLNKKLRRGDPFTVALGGIQVFKSPKLQGKKKKNRTVLETLQNLNLSSTTIQE